MTAAPVRSPFSPQKPDLGKLFDRLPPQALEHEMAGKIRAELALGAVSVFREGEVGLGFVGGRRVLLAGLGELVGA